MTASFDENKIDFHLKKHYHTYRISLANIPYLAASLTVEFFSVCIFTSRF